MKKMKEGINVKNIVIKCGADAILPFAIVFGFAVILFGSVSPGGGFQGGVITASAVLLLYLGYGTKIAKQAISSECLRVNEGIAAVVYVVLAGIALFMGASFCFNTLKFGSMGEMLAGGTITFMTYAVGYKVLTGVGFLLLMMLGLLAGKDEEEETE
ncbi:MAG TPA: MnhB domain-containing protein [Bacillota bacterium]|nr:MnhB domain-containing protein [Bacillota bacterium]